MSRIGCIIRALQRSEFVVQRKATEMLLWAHEQLVEADMGVPTLSQYHRSPSSGKISSIPQRVPKQRAALVAADTNIGKHALVMHLKINAA